jgi:phosphoglucosamine mutase
MVETQKALGELRAMQRVPQVLENVRVRERLPLTEIPDVTRVIAAAEERLHGSGRLLVRYSGTEMLARVMIEGEDYDLILELAGEISDVIRRHVGVE